MKIALFEPLQCPNKLGQRISGYAIPKRITTMPTKRREYTQVFKLETVSLVIDYKRKIAKVAESLGMGLSTLVS